MRDTPSCRAEIGAGGSRLSRGSTACHVSERYRSCRHRAKPLNVKVTMFTHFVFLGRALVLAATLFSTLTVPAAAQKPCADCGLRFSRVAVLGTDDGPGSLGGTGTVVRDSKGRYYVVAARMTDEVKVFAPQGTYLRTIGRRGSGPGEFLHIWRMTIQDDQLHVFDADNGRRTILRIPDGKILREDKMRWPAINLAVLPTNVVINANIRTPELAGIPLHRLSQEGEILESFGGDDEVFRTDIAYSGHRVITGSGMDGLWSSPRTEYVLTRWTLSGERLNTIRRNAEWFKPHARTVDFRPDHAPPPLVTQIHEDSSGLLWVLISVADDDWRQALTLRRDHPDGPTYVPRDMHSYFDTIVEVLDPATGRLLSSARVDRYITRFADATHLVSFTESSTGAPRAEIWRVEITPTTKE